MKVHKPSDKMRETLQKVHTLMIESSDFMEAYGLNFTRSRRDVLVGDMQASCVPCLMAIRHLPLAKVFASCIEPMSP